MKKLFALAAILVAFISITSYAVFLPCSGTIHSSSGASEVCGVFVGNPSDYEDQNGQFKGGTIICVPPVDDYCWKIVPGGIELGCIGQTAPEGTPFVPTDVLWVD